MSSVTIFHGHTENMKTLQLLSGRTPTYPIQCNDSQVHDFITCWWINIQNMQSSLLRNSTGYRWYPYGMSHFNLCQNSQLLDKFPWWKDNNAWAKASIQRIVIKHESGNHNHSVVSLWMFIETKSGRSGKNLKIDRAKEIWKKKKIRRNQNIKYSIRFPWQGFGSGEATGVASERSSQKFPLFPMEPMPDDSKKDPQIAKVEPISDGSSTAGITY